MKSQALLKLLIIGVFIVAVLSFISMTRKEQADDSALRCSQIREAHEQAIERYTAKFNALPVSLTQLSDMVDPAFFMKCPSGGAFCLQKQGDTCFVECSVHGH